MACDGWSATARQTVAHTDPERIARDRELANALRHSDEQKPRIECDRVVARVMTEVMEEDLDLFKRHTGCPDFRDGGQGTVCSLMRARAMLGGPCG